MGDGSRPISRAAALYKLLARGLGAPVHHPYLSVGRPALAVTWDITVPGGYATHAGSIGAADALDRVSLLARPSEQGLPPIEALGHTMWGTLPRTESIPVEMMLQLAAPLDDPATPLAYMRSPFEGVIGAAVIDSTLFVVGPVRGATPRDPVVSLALQPFLIRCN